MLMLLCTVMGIVVFLFTLYHLYLAGSNVTTNETFKWSQYRSYWNHQQAKKAKQRGEHDKFRCCKCFNYCIGAKGGEKFPSNKYNEGIIKNFYSVIFPKSIYNRAPKKYTDLKKWDRVLKRMKAEEEESAKSKKSVTTNPVKQKLTKRKAAGKKSKRGN